MTRILSDGRRPAASGRTGSVLVFLHGYGADGADLLGLSSALAPVLPSTAFRAPNAPERSIVNPMGYQWFPVPWIDGSSQDAAARGMAAAAGDLDAYLHGVLEAEGVSADRLALMGFSQGTMMALHVAPRWPEPFAAVVGFSGRLLRPDLLAAETVSKPPIFLAHGTLDDVVPPDSMPQAADALRAAGFDVETFAMNGTAHGIAPDGLRLASEFLAPRLGT